MANINGYTVLRQPAIRSGLSLFLSGVAFCGIGRYMKIEGKPLAFQIKAFSIAAIAQTAIHATIGNNSENSRVFEFIAPVVLIGIVAKKSRFKKLVVSTSLVSIGCFVINAGLKRLGAPPPPPPEDPLPPPEPAELTLTPKEFRDRWRVNNIPNKPITITGDLYVRPQHTPEYAALTHLPDNVIVNGTLNLDGCTNLKELPENLRVAGELHLDGCFNLERIPATIQVGGYLNLRGCVKLTELPMNRTNGGLCIDDCIRIKELPENLYVNGDLSIFNHPITELPRGLHVGGELELQNCENLREIPEDLKRLGGLSIADCPLIEALPEGLEIGAKGMFIADCERLNALPSDIRIEGRLRIDNNIPELPENLYVGGELRVGGSLCELPRGLRVGGELYLDEVFISSLPDDLIVDGDLVVIHGDTNLLTRSYSMQLPDWVWHMGPAKSPFTAEPVQRTIQLEYTHISRADGESLRQTYAGNRNIKLVLPDVYYSEQRQANSARVYGNPNVLKNGLFNEQLNILGILDLEDPKEEDIKQAYKRLALECHPDKVQGKEEQFRKIKEAETALLDAINE